jgi:hypothetical protein
LKNKNKKSFRKKKFLKNKNKKSFEKKIKKVFPKKKL